MNNNLFEFFVWAVTFTLIVAAFFVGIDMVSPWFGKSLFAVSIGLLGGYALIQTFKAFGNLFPDDEGKYD